MPKGAKERLCVSCKEPGLKQPDMGTSDMSFQKQRGLLQFHAVSAEELREQNLKPVAPPFPGLSPDPEVTKPFWENKGKGYTP